MRFLQSDGNNGLCLSADLDPKTHPYAILSHTWGQDQDEVTFEDMQSGSGDTKIGWEKLKFCCAQAKKDNLDHFWVDTCCINRASSSEVQEAVTSMFLWYRNATKCYVYLEDVSISEDWANDQGPPYLWESSFRRSRWFTRGWTLQELIAPASVEFFSVQGTRLGDKRSLEECIHEVTGIPSQVLQEGSLDDFSIPERLMWAENRQTKRQEDRAYCLLGVCDIFMPLLYGEGDHAYARLLEEIDKKSAEKAKLDYLLTTLPIAPQAAFNSPENQYRPICLPNTRIELLQDIAKWADGLHQRYIFWLNGIAGTGKSTIAHTVAKMYDKQGNLGASFFFSRGGGDVGHADRVVPSLAVQLATRIPSARRHICKAIEENKNIASQSLRDQWDQLILNPLSKLDFNPALSTVVLVIDALDECASERDIRILLNQLALSKPPSNIRLRIFITSRPESSVRIGFSHIPQDKLQEFVLHNIPPTIVNRDLRLFFKHRFKSIREHRGYAADWPDTSIIRRLAEASCGSFGWAATACRFIRDGRRQGKRRISILIKENSSDAGLEKQLDKIYITVLRDTIEQGYTDEEKQELYELSRKVLGSIVILFSPLCMDSLANLLNLPSSDIHETLADLQTVFNIAHQKKRPIRLHYPTFRDFLLNKDRCRDLNFWVDEKQAHKVLADNCIDLMLKMLRRDINGLLSAGTLAKDVKPDLIEQYIPLELQYACIYWVHHYQKSGTRLRDGDHAHLFLKDYCLSWIEAMNLIGKTTEMATSIRLYQSLLLPAENLRQLAFVKQLRQFIFALQSTNEQAPLQTYGAVLALIRSINEPRQESSNQVHPSIEAVRITQAIAPDDKDQYNYANDIAFTPDGRQVASGSINEVVRLWDVATTATLGKFKGQTDKVSSVAISTDGTMIASGSDDATVMVWNMKTREILYTLKGHSRWVNSVAFSPDGKLLASGSMDETVRVSDAIRGEELHVYDHSSCVNSVAFSPDGSLIASGSEDRVLRLWDVSNGEIRHMLDGHSGCINCVRFSPNGKRVVSGSDDMTIKLWDTATGTEYMTLKGHSKTVWAVTFSPGGLLIASGSEDMTVRLWNAATGALMAKLKGHTSGVNAVTFSPDSRLLASGAFNDEMRIWDGKTGVALGELDEFEESVTSDSSIKPVAGDAVLGQNYGDHSNEYHVHANNHQRAGSSSSEMMKSIEDGSTVASSEEEESSSNFWDDGLISCVSF